MSVTRYSAPLKVPPPDHVGRQSPDHLGPSVGRGTDLGIGGIFYRGERMKIAAILGMNR
jgi:hypothetical protein